MNKRIYLCLAHMSGNEQKYIDEAFRSNWVVPLGPNVDGFEADLHHFMLKDHPQLEHKQVVALSSGTAAIHLALLGCGVGPGDEVCVQSFTFCASCNPVRYVGGVPILIDSEPDTWNMDPTLLEQAIVERKSITGRYPKAIIVVALYGMPYNIEAIMDIANRYGIPVIEDAAEGLGSRFDGQALGTFGKYGVLSFNGNKMITTSGGGALICPDMDSKTRTLFYATQARDNYPYYEHTHIGYNYRLSNICAGIGRGQMTVLNEHIAHHQRLAKMYEKALANLPGVSFHACPDARYESNYWLSCITLDEHVHVVGEEAVQIEAGQVAPNRNIEALRIYMDKAGIETRPLWKPMHLQPIYADAPAYLNGVSEHLFRVGLCLPSGPMVTDEDFDYIISTLKEAIK